METGVMTGWVFVHDGKKTICDQYNENQTTISGHTIETFDREVDMVIVIIARGMKRTKEDKENNVSP